MISSMIDSFSHVKPNPVEREQKKNFLRSSAKRNGRFRYIRSHTILSMLRSGYLMNYRRDWKAFKPANELGSLAKSMTHPDPQMRSDLEFVSKN